MDQEGVKMKIINKTKKYYHVRVSEEELNLLKKAVKKQNNEAQREIETQEYCKWFFSNHVEISWQDEYSSGQSDWKDINTGKSIQTPDYFSVLMYRHMFDKECEEAKRKYSRKKGYRVL
jgi:hypothetical protein